MNASFPSLDSSGFQEVLYLEAKCATSASTRGQWVEPCLWSNTRQTFPWDSFTFLKTVLMRPSPFPGVSVAASKILLTLYYENV